MDQNTETFRRRLFIGVPAEALWPWLVEPERVWQYHLAGLETRPLSPGDPVRFVNRLAGQAVVEGEVVQIIEGRRLVHTFQYVEEFPEPPSRVTYEILRYGGQMCCLELTHEDLQPGGNTARGISNTWDVVLSSLKTLVETGAPLPWPGRAARHDS